MYIILRDRSERNFWAYRPATALRPRPPQNPNLVFRKNKWKRGPMFVRRLFYSFFSNYVGQPIFQNFRHDFFTRFSTNLTHVSRSFCGVEMRPMFTDLCVCVKSTHLGGTFPYYSLHMLSYSPAPNPLKGHPNNSAILSICEMHRYENFATKLWESVGKGHLYERVISAGTLEWGGTLLVPPQPGCPRVCPPWAHRSYATGPRERRICFSLANSVEFINCLWNLT